MIITAEVELANPWGNEPSAADIEGRLPLAIVTASDRAHYGDALKEIAGRARQLAKYITDKRKPFAESANQVTAHFADATATLDRIERSLKQQIGAFDIAARKREEEERAAAERARAEEQRKLNEEAEAARRRLQAAAERMDSKGNTEAALAVLDRAEGIQPAIAPAAPKVLPQARSAGSTRVIYRARVVDELLVPDLYKVVDVAALNRVGQATQGKIAIPGVEWVAEAQVAAR